MKIAIRPGPAFAALFALARSPGRGVFAGQPAGREGLDDASCADDDHPAHRTSQKPPFLDDSGSCPPNPFIG